MLLTKYLLKVLGSLLLSISMGLAASPAARAYNYEPDFVAFFNPQAAEAPESVATDLLGNRYVSMGFTGEIRKIDKHGNPSTHAVLPLGAPFTFCGEFPNFMAALAIDPLGNIFVGVNSCEPQNRGVYKVKPNGSFELLANFPLDAGLNGIALRLGKLYVADLYKGVIYRLPKNGGPVEVWADHALLKRVPNPFNAPGPNGVQFYDFINGSELYVVNSSTGDIVAIPVKLNGSAGNPRVHAHVVPSCDDFSFDIVGNIYCATNVTNTVLKIDPEGNYEAILTAEDGLDIPTATAFGRLQDNNTLYVANGAFPFLPTIFQPSLMEVEVEFSGYPLR